MEWERCLLRLPESKTGAKTLYLGPPALAILEGLGPQRQGLVLPGVKAGKPMAHPQKVWRRLCLLAGIEGVRPHDLRHTFASMGATLGVSLHVVGTLLGHADTASTQRYTHLAPHAVQEAARMVGEALWEALGGS